jgi:hypothetical protein
MGGLGEEIDKRLLQAEFLGYHKAASVPGLPGPIERVVVSGSCSSSQFMRIQRSGSMECDGVGSANFPGEVMTVKIRIVAAIVREQRWFPARLGICIFVFLYHRCMAVLRVLVFLFLHELLHHSGIRSLEQAPQ